MTTKWNQSLDGTWQLYLARHSRVESWPELPSTVEELNALRVTSVPAQVPGNFELDLQRAGMLPDLFWDENVLSAQQMEDVHLWYCLQFTPERVEDCVLHFEGIDTFARAYLNGRLIGSAHNMFMEHQMEAVGLHPGKNQLVVHIRPAAIEARSLPLEAGVTMHQRYNADSLAVRKAQHMYGWDIMPRILSGGLWRSVSLRQLTTNCMEDLYLYTVELMPERATVWGYFRLNVPSASLRGCRIKLFGRCGESRFQTEHTPWHTEGRLEFEIQQPLLWWPKDMGEPNLYQVRAELHGPDGLMDVMELTLGVRTVALERTSLTDQRGSGAFRFVINGQPLFVRGTNWVPLDALHSRDVQRLPQALALLDDVGCNMVRCWGGGVYEPHEFYDFCDRCGICVWQDFAMGCATYPQDDTFCSRIEEEVAHIVRRYRRHPSIVLWAGDNECDVARAVWSPFVRDPNQNRLTRQIIPQVLERLDPARPYLPSSPYIDQAAFDSGRLDDLPEDHLWGPRDYYKGDYYRTSNAHFASETGYHGCPSPASVAKFLPADKLWPWQGNTGWQVHASCMETAPDAAYSYRIPLMAGQIQVLFGQIPDGLEAFSLASQISQAEADKFFIERFRTGKWRRTGIIWWNLLDGWPQFSDAVVDYYFEKKLAYHAIKRVQAPVCLMFREPERGVLTLIGANETLTEQRAAYTVTDLARSQLVAHGTCTLPPNSAVEVQNVPYCEKTAHFYLIEWTVEGKDYQNHYLSGKPPFSFEDCVAWYRRAGFPV